MLLDSKENGAFLVRKSESVKGAYVLSVCGSVTDVSRGRVEFPV